MLLLISAKNIPTQNNYQYTDFNYLSGVKFYRLKMVDIDGHLTYSPTLKVEISNKKWIGLYPNPTYNYITLELPYKFEGIVTFFNIKGEKVLQMNSVSNGQRINIQKLPSGIYLVQALQKGETYTEKFIKN